MKKTFILTTLLFCTLSLFGCTSKQEGVIGAYLDEGYEMSYTIDEENLKFYAMMYKQDKSSYHLIKMPISKKELQAYKSIDLFESEDYEKECEDLILTFTGNIDITILDNKIPTQEELDQYIDKPFSYLENQGYEEYSHWMSDTSSAFYYSKDYLDENYSLGLILTPNEIITVNFDDLTPDYISSLTVAKVEFSGFMPTFSY